MNDPSSEPEFNGNGDTETDETKQQIVTVNCGKCQAQFQFPVDTNVLSFGFDCTNCGSHNEVDISSAG